MRTSLLLHARHVAHDAAMEAGAIARERFRGDVDVRAKGTAGDVVTAADLAAERAILERIGAAFPAHRIRSEEAGVVGGDDPDHEWHVDPLDGTNNFAIGLPIYGVSIALLHRGVPVVAAVHESHHGMTSVAMRGDGGDVDGVPLGVAAPKAVDRLHVSWVKGHDVPKTAAVMALKNRVDAACRRVFSLWAPAVGWAMLARGDLDAVVLYDSEGEDLYAGLLLAREAGAAVVDFDGRPFDRLDPHPFLVAGHPDVVPDLLDLVRDR